MSVRATERAATPFRLLRPPPSGPDGGPGAGPRLDPEQRAVVEHRGGPLLVLAGPGTGKTTTLVEAVLDRTRGPGALRAEEILVLTFSRAAAAELRERIGARLAPGAGAPTATTFHSFCYALLGQYQEPELLGDPLRLLSGPEQEVAIRELVRGTVEPGGWGTSPGGWPAALRAALGTRGFAEELRAVLARARHLGLEPEDLAAFAERTGRPDWLAAARFFGEYLDVADARGVLDYAELVHRAALLCESAEIRSALRAQYRAVFVDEYQDTDSAQVRLLQALAGDGRDLIVVGDPDQSIYAFRGADVNGILDFREAFRRLDGDPAEVVVLRNSRRAGPTLLKASRAVARRIPITRLPADRVRQHRDLHSVMVPVTDTETGNTSDSDGRVEVVEVIAFPDAASELTTIADLLRRAHLEDGVPWEQMAVLARDGLQLATVRRALLAANVPVEVLGDDLPLAQEPAVGTLLMALRCAAEPAALTAQVARSLLTGPLGGLDSADLRRLGRALRAEEQAALSAARVARSAEPGLRPAPESDPTPGSGTPPHLDSAPAPDPASQAGPTPASGTAPESDSASQSDSGRESDSDSDSDADPESEVDPGARTSADSRSVPLPRPADHLIREAVADPRVLAAIDPQIGGSALVVARLLQAARDALAEGGTVEDALWLLWNGDTRVRPSVRSGWPERLRRTVERGGSAGRLADRDLDAVIALFAQAARARERSGYVGVTDFISDLQAQAIAADTIADRAARGGAVQVLTAHRSKGLQWRVVVVVGVQEGLWPNLRRRGSLLEPDRIGRTGLAELPSAASMLAEERRLFYVAVTRARERLIVTAVDDSDEDGESPSRFLGELGVEVRRAAGFRRRPLNLAALIAELRRAASDPAAPPRLRAEATRRLARLASATAPNGGHLVPNAHPQQWWGLYDYTENETPITDPGGPVRLSASAVAALDACGLRWFLESQASAKEPSTDAQGIGVLFHALAEEVAVGKTKPDIDVLMDRLDRVWDSLPFDAPWKSEQEKRAARRALERFLVWHEGRADGRVFAAAEHGFEVSLAVGGIPVVLRGAIDRIELDAEGRAYLVDFKTSVTPKTRAEVAEDPQLGVYQLAVESGAYTASPGENPASGIEQSTAHPVQPGAAPGEAAPRETASGEMAPGGTVPGQALPSEGALGGVLPGEGVWGAVVPGEGVPGGGASGGAMVVVPGGAGTPTIAQAELVYPRDRSDAPGPTVLVQPGRSVQPDPEWATKLVAEVAQRVLDERFHAYGESNVCAICRLKKACPKRPEGRELPT